MQAKHEEIAVLYKSIMDTAVDGIIIINDRGVIQTVNKATLDIFNYTENELIGSNVSILMTNENRHDHDSYLKNYLDTRKPKIIGIGRDVIGRRKDGTEFHLRLGVSEVVVDGRILFTGILHDITPIKDSYKQLEKLNTELDSKVIERTFEIENVVNQLLEVNSNLNKEISNRQVVEDELRTTQAQLEVLLSQEKELNELKSRFITTASHEFRTPLASILSSVSLIEAYNSDTQIEKRLNHVYKIKQAVNYLTSLLNDILSLSKIEEGKLAMELSKVDVKDLLDKAAMELAPLYKTNQSIRVSYNSDRTIETETDPKILKNVFFNLLGNAIKYSEKDVLVDLQIATETYTLTITDYGIGIPQSDQAHLFSRFFRASNVGNAPGTGLGLNIVKRYCDMLDILIDLESVENDHTAITLVIPKR
jgi:two-component system sensor kinase FixL